MTGYQLTFFTQQDRRHGHHPLHQWLMALIQSMGIRGATMTAAQEGLGGHHRLHSARFFDLADQPIEITVVVTDAESEELMTRLAAEPALHLFYSKTRVEFGLIGDPD
ncbi:DUF190 domain-containing protein [Pollutimonas bauzanensis]|uniref:Uncharacterized ACR, COG1993 n=1 Tax=Pollutimonas bauzanensis TaxID=658167 RepID=A0A1M5Y214_9BURK|nr:DUF190 domain-containing protein [Pollutimonas bauzanensis]SHI06087.1 Uncharacterized ACR, COG1993 [Pollutimonas bauzanensis]SHI39558.1 Uncharacterized ACR, COG1993 [Pollutimonas bauzanensis]